MSPPNGIPPDFRWCFSGSQNLVRHSEPTDAYNCFAYAGGETHRWWDAGIDHYWPVEKPLTLTLPEVQKAYATLGYRPCADGTLEPGREKIALYLGITSNTEPAVVKHAALQLESGRWASKLGRHIDVTHSCQDLYGSEYGNHASFMARPRTGAATS